MKRETLFIARFMSFDCVSVPAKANGNFFPTIETNFVFLYYIPISFFHRRRKRGDRPRII